MSKVLIVAVEYMEPEWQQTKTLIEKLAADYNGSGNGSCTVKYVGRDGVGSLAEAYNRGFRKAQGHEYDYVWLLSNISSVSGFVTGEVKDPISILIEHMCVFDLPGLPSEVAATHPAFESDHLHLRPKKDMDWEAAPYIEFTAPFIRAEIFAKYPLDEAMPYWGHDLDWSYRVAQAGYTLTVDHSVVLGHSYIRHSKANGTLHAVTRRRLMLRRRSDKSTEAALVAKYGKMWRNVLRWL